jgi:hypothetical protein
MKINKFLEQRGKDIGVVGAGRNSQLENMSHFYVLRQECFYKGLIATLTS